MGREEGGMIIASVSSRKQEFGILIADVAGLSSRGDARPFSIRNYCFRKANA